LAPRLATILVRLSAAASIERCTLPWREQWEPLRHLADLTCDIATIGRVTGGVRKGKCGSLGSQQERRRSPCGDARGGGGDQVGKHERPDGDKHDRRNRDGGRGYSIDLSSEKIP